MNRKKNAVKNLPLIKKKAENKKRTNELLRKSKVTKNKIEINVNRLNSFKRE